MGTNHRQRRLRQLVLSPLVLALVGFASALGCNGAASGPAPATGTGGAGTGQPAAALDGMVDVVVRRPQRASEPFVVVEEGALPVVPGGTMSLLVQLSEPAYTYLVWLDCQEQALPLYPWNTEKLEVRDLAQPPPLRQPAKIIYSPLLGGGWKFGERSGMETVLLLARRTPLPADIKLADLIKPLPSESPRTPTELSILGLEGGAEAVSILHPASPSGQPQTAPADDPLAALMVRLGKHFDLIRAVRFAHAAE